MRDYIDEASGRSSPSRTARLVGFALAKLETPRICLPQRPLRSARLAVEAPRPRAHRLGRPLGRGAGSRGDDARSARDESGCAGRSTTASGSPSTRSISSARSARCVERLATVEPGASFGSIHVQTDDVDTVVRAARDLRAAVAGRISGNRRAPAEKRLDSGLRRALRPRPGHAPAPCSRHLEPARLLRRAGDRARGGSSRAVHPVERGRVVDEYASVPEFHGPAAAR